MTTPDDRATANASPPTAAASEREALVERAQAWLAKRDEELERELPRERTYLDREIELVDFAASETAALAARVVELEKHVEHLKGVAQHQTERGDKWMGEHDELKRTLSDQLYAARAELARVRAERPSDAETLERAERILIGEGWNPNSSTVMDLRSKAAMLRPPSPAQPEADRAFPKWGFNPETGQPETILRTPQPEAETRCLCGDGGPGDYEGPLRDCPVHGEPPAQLRAPEPEAEADVFEVVAVVAARAVEHCEDESEAADAIVPILRERFGPLVEVLEFYAQHTDRPWRAQDALARLRARAAAGKGG